VPWSKLAEFEYAIEGWPSQVPKCNGWNLPQLQSISQEESRIKFVKAVPSDEVLDIVIPQDDEGEMQPVYEQLLPILEDQPLVTDTISTYADQLAGLYASHPAKPVAFMKWLREHKEYPTLLTKLGGDKAISDLVKKCRNADK
jgi:hypothetical protein